MANMSGFSSFWRKSILQETDTMYVIGDIIDRYPSGVDIAFYIMEHPNIILLKGNHEVMCLDTLGKRNVYGARALWQSNGGGSTRRELLYHCSAEERMEVLRFFEQAPEKMEIEVNGNQFYLVHGFPVDKGEDPLGPCGDRRPQTVSRQNSHCGPYTHFVFEKRLLKTIYHLVW